MNSISNFSCSKTILKPKCFTKLVVLKKPKMCSKCLQCLLLVCLDFGYNDKEIDFVITIFKKKNMFLDGCISKVS